MDSNPSCGIRVLEKILAVPSIGEHENKSAAWERWNKKQAMHFTLTALTIRRTVNRKGSVGIKTLRAESAQSEAGNFKE